MSTVATQIISFYQGLKPNWRLPRHIELLYPFDNQETIKSVGLFYKKYFSDTNYRRIILGINPGRFGAGVTGIPFTDPLILEEKCKIHNPFKKQNELSAIFVYEFIEAFGGIAEFYQDYFISSVCPLGFVKDGKNINYYDDTELYKAVEKHIVREIRKQIKEINIKTDIAFSLGKGLNYKYLSKLNKEHNFFAKIVPLPHPRWVMQYRRKTKKQHIQNIVDALHI